LESVKRSLEKDKLTAASALAEERQALMRSRIELRKCDKTIRSLEAGIKFLKPSKAEVTPGRRLPLSNLQTLGTRPARGLPAVSQALTSSTGRAAARANTQPSSSAPGRSPVAGSLLSSSTSMIAPDRGSQL